jgi:predicted nucleotidyltransferase
MTSSRAELWEWLSPMSIRIVGVLNEQGAIDILKLSKELPPGSPYATTYRWINKLERAGVVVSTHEGNRRIVSLRPYYLTEAIIELYNRLKFRDALHAAPKELANAALNILDGLKRFGVLEAYFYGSFAAKKAGKGSDIDVLVIIPDGSRAADYIRDLVLAISETLTGEIHPIIVEAKKFKELVDKKDPLVEEAKEGIKISFASTVTPEG